MSSYFKTENLGIMGGTFDPIHFGHLGCADVACKNFNLDKVMFMPSNITNFKQENTITRADYRFEMCRLALNEYNQEKFVLADEELQRGGISYTYDTLSLIKKEFPNKSLFFICGSDSAFNLPKWYKFEEILEMATIIAVFRVGYNFKTQEQKDFASIYKDRIKFIEADVIGISSSELREKINTKQDVKKYIPKSVLKFINNNNLYSN